MRFLYFLYNLLIYEEVKIQSDIKIEKYIVGFKHVRKSRGSTSKLAWDFRENAKYAGKQRGNASRRFGRVGFKFGKHCFHRITILKLHKNPIDALDVCNGILYTTDLHHVFTSRR